MPQPKVVSVPQLPWYGDTQFQLTFPPSWDVNVCRMEGEDARQLSDDEISEAFSKPIGSGRIRDIAQGREEIAILFDDLTRPTKVSQLVPYILDELREAGIADDHIRFIAATGAHGALNRVGWEKKLGEEVLNRFPVYNHNAYENCVSLGNTSHGIPVAINAEVMSCDFKIGIGCVTPHRLTGFGGGGKIIMPGVASIDTIEATHSLVKKAFTSQIDATVEPGKFEDSLVRPEVEEAVRMAHLDIKVDILVNTKRETTAIFVGDPIAEHHQAVTRAKEHYATKIINDVDIIIANAYSKASELIVALIPAAKLARKEGSSLVLVAVTPEGQITHYLTRSFGHKIGGRLWQPKTALPSKIERLIIFTPYMDRTAGDWIAPAEAVIWCQKWGEVIAELRRVYPGKAKVAVIPDSTIQYFPY